MLSKNEHEILSPSKKNFLARGVRRALFGALRYFIDQYITLDYQIVFVNIKSGAEIIQGDLFSIVGIEPGFHGNHGFFLGGHVRGILRMPGFHHKER